MKLYDGGKAPNPRRVRVFLAEKGVKVPLVPVEMGAMGHRSAEISQRNPLMQLPVLELDNGTIIAESAAICRYFEEVQPSPPLFGQDTEEKALIEMWHRHIEFQLFLPVAQAFRHIHPAMAAWEIPQIAEWGEANKPKALKFLGLLNEHLKDREFVAANRISIADILGMISIDFMKPARIELPGDLLNVRSWYEAMRSRPSAGA